MYALIAVLSVAAIPADVDAALADRATLPQSSWAYTYYLTTSPVEKWEQGDCAAAIKLWVPSTSRQQVLDRSVPQHVPGTSLYRIDIRELHWDYHDWQKVLASYPYEPAHKNPLIISAPWLLYELTDGNRSDAYYRLLYGGKGIPKTRDEFLAAWGIGKQPEHRFGLIVGNSGVATQGGRAGGRTRWVESFPILRGYAWGTRDVIKLTSKTDPLENPDGAFTHDGEEWLVYSPVVSTDKNLRGVLQRSLLADGKGKVIQVASGDLVEDYARFKGLAQIRNPGGCVMCHAVGLIHPGPSKLQKLLVNGVDLKAQYDEKEAIERFHFGDVGKDIARAQEDYEATVKAITGMSGLAAAEAINDCIDFYRKDLTLEQAARELGAKPDELRLALAYGSAQGIKLGARVSGLAHGLDCPRSSWEESGFRLAWDCWQIWKGEGA